MANEKMREEFEAEVKKQIPHLIPARTSEGTYLSPTVQAAWWGWNASRESLVIDINAAAKALAESMDYPWEFMPEEGRARMKANARMVIEAASLKVTP